MGLLMAVGTVALIILLRGISIFRHNAFVSQNTEEYKITPTYINTDIPLEMALEDFSMVEINER